LFLPEDVAGGEVWFSGVFGDADEEVFFAGIVFRFGIFAGCDPDFSSSM